MDHGLTVAEGSLFWCQITDYLLLQNTKQGQELQARHALESIDCESKSRASIIS